MILNECFIERQALKKCPPVPPDLAALAETGRLQVEGELSASKLSCEAIRFVTGQLRNNCG